MKSGLIAGYLVFFLVCSAAPSVHAQEINEYDIRNIPASILPGAKAIVRDHSVRFEVVNPQEGILKVKKAVTIFSKEEQGYGVLTLNYNKFVEISDLEGTLYDKTGEEIRDLESRDISDYSDFSSYSLLEDNRVKYSELYHDKYPYTVVFQYEINYDSYLNWPSWYSRESSDPVQHSEFKVTTPSDYKLRWWCNKDDAKPEISSQSSQINYLWQAENLTKLPDDQENEDLEDYAVIVKTAPSEFNIEGHHGSMTSWVDFGRWYSKLAEGRDNLPANALREIEEITKDCNSRDEKIKRLYNYMQSHTRYVSIQLGIGGWQPFEASFVHNNGYGDCKALSNYMISILKAAGIKACPVLIESGKQDISMITDFPSNQFNHVIVFIPGKKDTVWLECTSQDLPAGSLSSNCENRKALLITKGGGAIVNTPVTKADQNIQLRTADIVLHNTGSAEAKIHTEWTGDQHHYALSLSKNTTFNEQEKWIKRNFKVPDINLDKFSFTIKDRNSEVISLDISAILPRYGSAAGRRIFFTPNLTDRRTNVPNKISEKLSPVKYDYPYLDIDSIRFTIPPKYMIEAVPAEVSLETTFGSFISTTQVNEDNSLTFKRRLEIKDYSIPPEDYPEYSKFFSEIVKADRAQVVLSAKK